MDKAHNFVDDKLKSLEKELKILYGRSLKELEREIERKSSKILLKPNATQADIRRAVNRLNDLYKRMTIELNEVDLKAISMLEKDLKEIGVTNIEFAEKQIKDKIKKTGIDQTFAIANDKVLKNILQGSIFTELAIEGITDKNHIFNELKRSFAVGMSQGESIPKLSKRIQKIINSNKERAVLIARTETTRVENQARQEVYEGAVKDGIEMKKQWDAYVDNRTRKSHVSINGEIVGINDTFSNGLLYPGDSSGGASEVCNCRCSMTVLLKGVDY